MHNTRVSIFLVILLLGTVAAYDLTRDKCTYEVAVGHLDTHWQWTRKATYNTYIPATLHDNFTLFQVYPKYVFSFAGAFRYWKVEESDDRRYGNFLAGDWDKLKGYISSGRWSVCGSCIDEIDPNMSCAEALCRNFLYGNGYYEDRFGKRSLDIYLPDCFGFSYSLPTIANHFGVRGFSSQKFDLWGGWFPVPNNMAVFKWKGPDGSFIYAANKASDYNSGYEVNIAQGNAMQAQCGLWVTYDYYGLGDKGGAPSVDKVEAINSLPGGQANGAYCFFAGADSLFRDLVRLEKANHTSIDRMASYNGELTMETHGVGCYTHHDDVHVRYRNMELGGLSCEPAAVCAQKLVNRSYPQAAIWRAWFKGIDHAFHDDLTGTSIPDAYYNSWDGTIADLDSQITVFSGIKDSSNMAVASALNTQVIGTGAVPVVVYNPLGLDRRDVLQAVVTFSSASQFVRVIDPSGVETPSQVIGKSGNTDTILFIAAVPSLGYAVYEVRPSAVACTLNTGVSVTADGSSMSNGYYVVSIDATGDISQIVAKKQNNKELFQKASRWELRPDNSSTWPQWEILRNDVMRVTPSSVVDGSPVRTVVENGPVRVSVKVTRSKSNTNYTHFYRLCADSAGSLVTVDNRFNWNSRGNLLKAAFYLNVSADSAIYSVGVGTIKRPVSGTDKRYENPHQQWQTITDGTSGVAIIDHYKYGSSSLAKNNLMLTLVHSPGSTNWSTEGENRYPFNFSYAVYGYAGNWNKDGQVETQTQRFQMPLRGFQVAPHAGTAACGKQFSFVKVGDPSKIMIMALKKAGKTDKPESNSDYVVRVREISGSGPSSVKLLFGYDILSAKETNGMEDDSGAVDLTPGGTSNNEIAFSINRFQIKTFKVSLGTTYVQGATGIHSRGLVPGAIVSSEESAFTVKFAAHGRLISAKFPLHGGELVRSVSITNMAGRLVRKLHSGPKMLAAASTLMWDGRYKGGVIVPPGVYVINVKTNQSDKCAKLQFIR